ncbi:hypothetical protein [Spartinivicinus poritis]|uniref:Aspartate/ornithine carbamoyltransferase carbamoyl-P binding domain-containing protein n=1 Tax=Spartinivicinus poritis TaxID=2994640 RepID=A0ABT5UAA3_9GAMM|nr:hypothetical protein [Spartinivicinus sp. A2-2]MDE1463095.1 hypothetical protein [Spartinivicinus sp. A2-2]
MNQHGALYSEIIQKVDELGILHQHLFDLSGWSQDQFITLFKMADLMDELKNSGCQLMLGRVIYNLFFQPSTRTRTSYEYAMKQLGGQVINEVDPLRHSAVTRGESLKDTLRVVSEFANLIVLRHGNENEVLEAVELLGSRVSPIISGGFGHCYHPTQALADIYTVWRFINKPFKDIVVLLTSPDLSRGYRSGHAFAIGMAKLGARIVYTGSAEHMIPSNVRETLIDLGAKFEEFTDLSRIENLELLSRSDLVYLPITSLATDDVERELFLKRIQQHFISLADLESIKKSTGKVIGAMHPLPRNKNQFDYAIDNTEFELYFKTVKLSVPLRMALIAAVVGIPLSIRSQYS